jgi:Rrf2 family protein
MAVHVLAVLGHKGGGPVTSRKLAASVNTNPVIIRRLLLALQEAGLVTTRKGAGLGSSLHRPPERITLAQVYRAVDAGEPFVLPRRKPNPDCPVGHCIQLALEKVFGSVEAALERELAEVKLSDVLQTVADTCSGSKKPK